MSTALARYINTQQKHANTRASGYIYLNYFEPKFLIENSVDPVQSAYQYDNTTFIISFKLHSPL